jgi:uncharacterized protein with FMN-binding domain
MTEQPEALMLANILQHRIPSIECLERAAAELRRLHEVNAELLEALKELVDIVDGAISDRSTGNMDSFTLQPARIAITKAEDKP